MDGLQQDWNCGGAIFCNPPGGKVANRSNAELFWQKMNETTNFTHAIFMFFSAEAIQTTQRDGLGGCARFPFCTPSRRIAFDDATGRRGASPSHGNLIVYVPGSLNATEAFRDAFSPVGFVRV